MSLSSAYYVSTPLKSNAHVPLSSHSQIDQFDAGLNSVEGAHEIIEMISSRRMVARLVLGLNDLGDEGTIDLCKYLGSDPGKEYKVAEISLNSNGIGDRGLLAIAEYLTNNRHLKELFLQNNHFVGSPPVVEALTSALNTSVLETLSLTTNRGLSDSFIEQFLPKLDSPNLREIHLSAMGLTRRCTPYIIDYLASRRCCLHTFKCNGNALGYRSVCRIISALERRNFGLLRVELYSNQLVGNAEGEAVPGEEDEDERRGGLEARKESERFLKRVLLRNDYLKKQTRTEALRLLPLARALLCQPTRANETADIPRPRRHPAESCLCNPAPKSSPHTSRRAPSVALVFPFLCLPIELQLYILSFLAPILSSGQCVRIYTYAGSSSTLPPLLSLPSHRNVVYIPGPSELSGKMRMGYDGGGMGARNTQEERARWLSRVGCSSFEPKGDCDGRVPEFDFSRV